MRHAWMLGALIFLLTACQSEEKNVLSERQMERLLYDYHVSQALAAQFPDSVAFRQHLYADLVFAKYGITETEFHRNLQYYMRKAEILQRMYLRIGKRLESDAGNGGYGTSLASSHFTAKGDTSNVWKGSSFYLFNSYTASNQVSFVVRSDSTFHPGDRFVFCCHTSWLYSEGAREGVLSLCIRYANDSTVAKTQYLYSTGQQTVELEGGNVPIKSIEGFIFQPGSPIRKPRLMLVSQITLLKIHTPGSKQTPITPSPEKSPISADSIQPQSANTSEDGPILPSPARDSAEMSKRPHFRELQESKKPDKSEMHYRRGVLVSD